MRKIIVLIIAIFTINIANAQWVQTSLNNNSDNYVYAMTANGSNIYAGTDAKLFLSTNNGSSWTAMNTGMPTNYSVSGIAEKEILFLQALI